MKEMKMIKKSLIIPNEVEQLIPSIGNKTRQKSLLRVYNALLVKSKYKNKDGWFEVSSNYLLKVNSKYKNIIDYFE